MDKIIYKNKIGQLVEFSASSKYVLQNADDIGANVATWQSVSSPFQDGQTPVGNCYFNSKLLTINFTVLSSDVNTDIRELNSRLNPKIGVGEIHYVQNGFTKVLTYVTIRQLPTLRRALEKGHGYQMSVVVFEINNPLFKDLDFTEAIVESGGDGLIFPLNITNSFEFDYLNTDGVTVTNDGDMACPVEVVFVGPVDAPTIIRNETTGEQIVLDLSVLADEELTVTTDPNNINVILKNTIIGDTEVAFQYIDVSQTEFFQLEQGANLIIVTGDGTNVEQATIRFRNLYVGV